MYEKVWCPSCKEHCYVDLGDLNDCTQADVDGCKCPYCKYQWLFDWILEEDSDKDLKNSYIVKGQKTLT